MPNSKNTPVVETSDNNPEIYSVISDETTEAVLATVKDEPVVSTPAKSPKVNKPTPKENSKPKPAPAKSMEPTNPASTETTIEVLLSDLHPPEFHPFQVTDDEAMESLVTSIKQYGVQQPGIVRLRTNDKGQSIGGYEIVAGNRRKRASELAGLTAMPVIIRDLTDADAVITLVDSNLTQRERILPSERAWSYKIKLEALNHKGIKGDKTSAQIVAEQSDESRSQVFRVIKLTELILGLLDKVDSGKLSFNAGVELSVLSQKEQTEVVRMMEQGDMKPSLSQAVRLRELKKEGKLTIQLIQEVLAAPKPQSTASEKMVMPYRKFFPENYTPVQINTVILDLLESYQSQQLQKANDGLSTVANPIADPTGM